MAILLTGGAGYIGSHTAVSIHNAGQENEIDDKISTLLNAGLEIGIGDNL